MTNKTKRDLSLALMLLTILAYVILFLRILFSRHHHTAGWPFYFLSVLFVVSLALWQNFRRAVREDDIYGPRK